MKTQDLGAPSRRRKNRNQLRQPIESIGKRVVAAERKFRLAKRRDNQQYYTTKTEQLPKTTLIKAASLCAGYTGPDQKQKARWCY